MTQDTAHVTQHNTPREHTGEQESSGQGQGTRNPTHGARIRAAAQEIRGQKPPGWGKAPRRGETQPEHRERPDRTRRSAPRGATRHAREARHRPQPRHTDRCQATTATRCRKPGQRAPQPQNHGRGVTPKERRGQAAPERTDAPDWMVQGGPTTRNSRPPDSSIRGPEAVDAQDRIIRGGTSSGRHGEPERGPRGRGFGDAAKRRGGRGRGEAEKTR